MTYTPGPWIDLGRGTIVDTRRTPVAVTCFRTNGAPEEANARLIAAAPELLAALKAFMDISYNTEDSNFDDVCLARRKALAAIAKAESS